MRPLRVAVLALLAGLPVAVSAEKVTIGAGLAMDGFDESTVQLPVVGLFESYENAGYRVRVEGGVAHVVTSLEPLRSRDPFRLPEAALDGPTGDPIERLARSLTAGSTTRYEASSRVLDWVARNVRYEMDRSRSQDPHRVLERRSGYCTGVAKLTASLLDRVGIPVREVAGYVFGPSEMAGPHGYHRWIEIRYDDRGWVFSDPLGSHHYVPATYVPLASERLLPGVGGDPGVLLARVDARRVVDRVPWVPPGVTVRRNVGAQRAATLAIEVEGAGAVRATLRGGGSIRSQVLADGRGSFLDLQPGIYLLRVDVPEQPPIWKRVVFRGAVVGEVRIPIS